MTQDYIPPLRRRMIEDMTVRRFAAETKRNYIRAVKTFATFLGRSPDTATAEDLHLFQLHLNETHVRPPTINCTVTAAHRCPASDVRARATQAADHLEPRGGRTPAGGGARRHDPPSKWWTPLISSFGSGKVFDGYIASPTRMSSSRRRWGCWRAAAGR